MCCTGYSVNVSHCADDPLPPMEESCAAPCPVDCALGGADEWSVCSATCGPDAVRYRQRRVLRLAAHGGVACPEGAAEGGVVVETKPCRKVGACVHVFEKSVCACSSNVPNRGTS